MSGCRPEVTGVQLTEVARLSYCVQKCTLYKPAIVIILFVNQNIIIPYNADSVANFENGQI